MIARVADGQTLIFYGFCTRLGWESLDYNNSELMTTLEEQSWSSQLQLQGWQKSEAQSIRSSETGRPIQRTTQKIVQVFTNKTVKVQIEPDVQRVFNIRKMQPVRQ